MDKVLRYSFTRKIGFSNLYHKSTNIVIGTTKSEEPPFPISFSILLISGFLNTLKILQLKIFNGCYGFIIELLFLCNMETQIREDN